MSVQKFKVTKQGSGYTTLPNSVLQGIVDLEVLGLWCYFQSKPISWEFHQEQIRTLFDIGIHKLENILKILKQHNLIVITHEKDTRGRFSHWLLHVKNGSEFIPLSKNCSTEEIHRSPETVPTVTVLRSSAPIKERITKRKNIENKNKSFSKDSNAKKQNEKRHDWAAMKNEAAHVKSNNHLKKAPMPDNLRDFVKTIKKGLT